MQDKIHIQHFSGDKRNNRPSINLQLQRFAEQITTIRFQISIMVTIGIVDYLFILINGVSDKLPQYLVLFSIETAFFFAYVHLIFPRLASNPYSELTTICVLLASITLIVFFHILTYTLFAKDPILYLRTLSPNIVINAAYRGWHRMVFSFFLWSAYLIKASAKREQVLENSALYARISPHLLYNVLNMMSGPGSGLINNDKAVELISRYTKNAMMELNEDGKGFLIHELDQLETLLQLNELRFGKIYVQLHKVLPEDLTPFMVPPQIIITLAENVFKYGIVDDPQKPALILIEVSDSLLKVSMSNFKYPTPEGPSSKIGLKSVQNRLTNIYGKHHLFKVTDTDEVFAVEMALPI